MCGFQRFRAEICVFEAGILYFDQVPYEHSDQGLKALKILTFFFAERSGYFLFLRSDFGSSSLSSSLHPIRVVAIRVGKDAADVNFVCHGTAGSRF